MNNEDQPRRTVRSAHYDSALSIMSGETPDPNEALPLLESAHASGDARATYALATWYLNGLPPAVQKDMSRAILLLESAAEAGVPDALFDLGVAYERGENGRVDLEQAYKCYLRAALLGQLQSIYEVGRCHFYGIGTPEDREIAKIWLDRAAELGVEEEDGTPGLRS